MKFVDLMSASHTEDLVIYEGYHGDMQEPAFETRTADGFKLAMERYRRREVSCFEAVEDKLYIWLDDTEQNLHILAKKLISKLWEDEDGNADIVAEILSSFGFDYDHLWMLNVCDDAILRAMFKIERKAQ